MPCCSWCAAAKLRIVAQRHYPDYPAAAFLQLGRSPTKEQLCDYVWATLKGGKVSRWT